MTEVRKCKLYTYQFRLLSSADLLTSLHFFGTWSCGIWKYIGVQARCVNERSARDSWHVTSATSSGQKCFSTFWLILRFYGQNKCPRLNIIHFASLFIYTCASFYANQKCCSSIDRKVRERRKCCGRARYCACRGKLDLLRVTLRYNDKDWGAEKIALFQFSVCTQLAFWSTKLRINPLVLDCISPKCKIFSFLCLEFDLERKSGDSCRTASMQWPA